MLGGISNTVGRGGFGAHPTDHTNTILYYTMLYYSILYYNILGVGAHPTDHTKTTPRHAEERQLSCMHDFAVRVLDASDCRGIWLFRAMQNEMIRDNIIKQTVDADCQKTHQRLLDKGRPFTRGSLCPPKLPLSRKE